ncbi:MAG: glycoside hydrolase/phage tail family protein [Pseudomonadota bacterium]
MATILLSAAGAAIGGSIGGTVLGLSAAAVGRFAGAIIGRSIDQKLMGQGSEAIETGKISRLRLTGTGEGDAIARVWGKMRVAGNVIWASEFLENREVIPGSGGGGKGSAPPTPTQVRYSYSVSLAIGLCEGEVSHVGRIWADGIELSRDSITMRFYPGSLDQLPDPKIEAIEGAGTVPAYRGTAYVVIEDLDLTNFGGRVPQLTFEVNRPVQKGLPGADLDPVHAVRGVALLPGSGEYVLATTPVQVAAAAGSTRVANVNTASAKSDFLVALDNLQGELPNCGATSLIVSWLGDDLRCGECTIQPKVERRNADGINQPWFSGGQNRVTAQLVPTDASGAPVYGGTPSDQSVIEAIRALNTAGQEVLYYPFILMDQTEGNGRPDPYSDAPDQPILPWRGRITTSIAPGRDGSPDGTAQAEAEVATFFGTATAADFSIGSGVAPPPSPLQNFDPFRYTGSVGISPVSYTGPNEFGYRRFILHQAALCLAAGGVESFCIGSEMRGLTQIRGANNSFPAVTQLRALAAEVRTMLGPDVKISYAADWSEYFGYQPQDGSGDRFFHLDPLWADPNIDFIAIDNYMPLSDWRDGVDHLDAQDYTSIYDLDYLMANVQGGEGYDWFYHSEQAREAQIRTPISDGAFGEPWIFRYKDIFNWWRSGHFERIGGVRVETPTSWVPESKPIRFTEYGCGAVDKGANQPNKFIDPKSSESSLPYFSNGLRDDLMQFQYLRAMSGYWNDPANNPISEVYGAPMIDMDHAYVWAWDARPFPFFPNRLDLWSDGENYLRGHWITGRVSAQRLASVVEELCGDVGLEHCNTDDLHGHVKGYVVEQVAEPRSILQPLMLKHGADVVERGGELRFRLRDGLADFAVDPDLVVRDAESGTTIEEMRGSDVELAGRVRLRFIEADADFEIVAEEASLPDDDLKTVSTSEFPLAMTRTEGRQTVERWLAESRLATDTANFTLPRSNLTVGAGDVVSLPEDGGAGLFRVDRVELLPHAQKIEAVRVEPETYSAIPFLERLGPVRTISAPGLVRPFFMDLPLLTGEEVPHAPYIAVTADPWSGSAALYSSSQDAGYALDQVLNLRTPVGITQTPLNPARAGLIDRGDPVRVEMVFGTLDTVDDAQLLGGANLCAIGDGTPGNWELIQFRDAELVEESIYELSHRLRGQLGSETPTSWPEGSYLVRLDGSPQQINLTVAQLGLSRFYRVGPANQPIGGPAFSVAELAFEGVGLRPLSPVHLRLSGNPGEDRTATWIRRTRIGGDSWQGLDVPLGEESEQYLVRVRQGQSLVRETIVESPEWTYDLSAQSADGIVGAFRVEVGQISAVVGVGRIAQVSAVA